MMQIPMAVQQIAVGVIVASALIWVIRLRIKSAKSKSGSCPNCSVDH